MTQPKEKLNFVLKRLFQEKGWKISLVCARLGTPTDSFRVRLSRNRFPSDLLLQIASLVGLPSDIEELKSQYEFEISHRTMSSRTTYPENILPVLKAVAGTKLEKLTMNELFYILNLQRDFSQPLTPIFIEEAMRLR